ncbi:hypothetical protein M2145_001000 [Lachnospiraceae bacterium PF1-21]|uniref:hypothetical protein n=1 Tax=Ohessyouella blattaphilus TaxID=2949333 RepID=UPI003E2DF5A7
MFKRKYHIHYSYEELRRIIEGLIEFKNHLISQGRYTDAVDELIMTLYKQMK